jgi:hypothetical protein
VSNTRQTPDSIGTHLAYLIAIASAMGPQWSVRDDFGHVELTDGTVRLAVSWYTKNRRLRFYGYYGHHRYLDTSVALTREPAAVARQLLTRQEATLNDSARRVPRCAAQDLLAPFLESPWTSRSQGADPDAHATVVAGRVRGKITLNLTSSTCELALGKLALPEVLEVLAVLDGRGPGKALSALLAVTNEPPHAAFARDLLAPFTVSWPVRARLKCNPDGSDISLELGMLAPAAALEVLAALAEGRLAGALAALLTGPAARPINNTHS